MRSAPEGQTGLERPPHEQSVEQPPPPGQGPVLLAGLAIGVTLLAVQLWLLTVALELYLAGSGGEIWRLALISGAIFLGGLLMLWLLRRRPRVPQVTAGQPEVLGR
jgi:hypothetical protein